MPTEKRHSGRRQAALRLQINYTDVYGAVRFEYANANDISETGCQVTLRFPVEPRSVLNLSSPPRFQFSAIARYQRATPKGYITGLEFAGGYRLTANN
jgi:hypothetical protein